MGPTGGAKCNKCKVIYHLPCLGLTEKDKLPATWICVECKRHVPRDNRADTPVRGAPSQVEPDVNEVVYTAEVSGNTAASDMTEETKVELGLEIRLFRDELRAVREEIRQFRERPGHATERPRVTVSQIPEENGENPLQIVALVATKLGVKLDERDIVSAERVGPRHRSGRASGESGEGAGAGGSAERPRPLVVRVTRRALKDELIKSARVRRGATTADLGLSAAPRPFYVNDRLTKTNRLLFNRAREAKKQLHWRFVWTKQGRVYARQEEGKARHWIRSEGDLTRVFGSALVS
ncbi:hypothetical protein JYU34_010692 [Plutella xylostella]|uniref:FP protein C-terminal domain-containing protein n=1 Tax=Plutella xylostella TaxID=51655 RepID=A0ABQ7QEZ6_PLUXY|nr:hypothetical protein JYU34_010692 [Plutella xylostella]